MQIETMSCELLDSLQPTNKDVAHSFPRYSGLYFKVRRSGAKTWLVKKKVSGKTYNKQLGTYPSVQPDEALKNYQKVIANIIASASEDNSKTSITSNLAGFYKSYPFQELTPKSQKDYKAYLVLMQSLLKDDSIESLTPLAIQTMMEVIGEDNPVKANRFKSAVSKFCKYLIVHEKISVNPTVSLLTYKEESDKRHLLEGELKDFFRYLREESQMGEVTRDLVMLFLLTGCRLNELRQLHRREISDDYLTIPSERVKKSDYDHIVPLVPTAKAILDKYSDNKGLIFVNKLGGLIGNETVTQALYRYCQLKEVERFSTHDLRRTVGTHLAILRVEPFIRKKILGHKDPDVTEDVYTIYDYLPEKREALLKLENKMLHLGLAV